MVKTFSHSLVFTVLVALSLTLISTAYAQSRDLVNRLNRLENDIQTLNQALFKGKQPSPSYFSRSQQAASGSQAAQLEVRLSQLEQQIRVLTGKVEQNAFEARQARAELQRAMQDIELRFRDIQKTPQPVGGLSNILSQQNNFPTQKNLNVTPTGRPTAVTAPSVPAPLAADENAPAPATSGSVQNLGSLGGAASNNPVTAYESAFSHLRSGKYGDAEAGFRSFLSSYPDHNLAANAQYWLAETYYVRGNYEQASRGFAVGYQKYPKSTKAPDNLLKLGLSLANSGKKEDACLTFKQLDSAFPNAPIPLKRRVVQERARIGC